MTIFAGPPHQLRASAAPTRFRILAAGLALGIVVAMLLIVPGAWAVVTPEIEGAHFGVQPRSSTLLTPGEEPATFANETGNAVLNGSTSEYAIYWDPNKPTEFTHEWVANLDEFFHSLGEARTDTPFGVLSQYRDRSNTVAAFHALFKGSYSDTVKFPAGDCTDPKNPARTCLTDAQVREQLRSFIATHSLPKGMGTIYYLLTPPGVTVCLDTAATRCSDYKLSKTEEEHGERKSVSYENSFCSYHGDINPDSAAEGDGSTILYAAIPWTGYTNAYDCQDGGWNPEKHLEKHEAPKGRSTSEQTTFEEAPQKTKEAEEEKELLEGPHIEEPNQVAENYSSALTDILVNQISEEEMNTVTDPLLTSWKDAQGNEATDICRNAFASTAGEGGSKGGIGGSVVANAETAAGTLSNVTVGRNGYYINNVFSLAEGGCSGGLGLTAAFTAPNPVNAGDIIGVDGMESEVSLSTTKAFGPSGPPTNTYATFSWNFGDGTPEVTGFAPGAPTCELPWLSPCAASAFHAYQYGGTYTITLTITDVAGNVTSVTHEVTVNGPSRPSSQPAAAGSSVAAQAQTPQGGGSAGGKGASASVPAPVVAAAIVKQSLHKALRKGLVVSYSVNEQVAGHFEVLLSSATAHRLGVGGAPAVGLPAGSPSEVVIAKAILVTTKGGRSAIHIAFSKHTASRLARAHKVSLLLRLIVRNAATIHPLTTTVLSSVTLNG